MIDLEGMSRPELMRLRADVDRAIAGVADREKRAALKAAEEAARTHGFSLADLMEGRGRAARGRRGGARASGGAGRDASEAKYRNPDNAEQTWSGRGRRPRWIHEAEAKGRSLADLAV